MIQALILVALVVIAVVLAPWLLGLIAMAVAAFGVYAVILGGLLALAIIAGALWGLVTSMRSEKREADPILGDRVACTARPRYQPGWCTVITATQDCNNRIPRH